MRAIFPIVYFVLAIIQFLALVTGIQEIGVHWLLSGIVAFLIATIPIIGTIGGIYGAVEGWGWPLYQAITLFVGPLLLTAAIVGISYLLEEK